MRERMRLYRRSQSVQRVANNIIDGTALRFDYVQ